MDKIVDIDSIESLAPDNLSKILSTLLTSLMDLKRLNSFYASLPAKVGDKNFASSALESLNISRLVKGVDFPSSGPVIAVVPIVSGILEILASISEIIEKSSRNDIKIIPFNSWFQSFDFLSPYYLSSKTFSPTSLMYSSISHLRSGGALIYFVQMNSIKFSFDSHFVIPFKLSRLTKTPVVNVLIDFDANFKYSWTTFFGKWCFLFFSVRRFFANSGTSMMTILGQPQVCDENIIDDNFTETLLQNFYIHTIKSLSEDSVFNIARKFKNVISNIVPRGTKRS